MNNKRNSTIILAKGINMDDEYINIIDYSESNVVELCESNSHLVAKQNNYSFLKPNENVINVGIPYETCLQANYIAFQNPYYSNKWFFGFIERVEYNSELSTNIYYKIDEISTWWDYWSKNKQSFVVREHVNDDTIGLHTIDEGLGTGDYVCNGVESRLFTNLHFVIQYSIGTNKTTNVNGIVQPGLFYTVVSQADYESAITAIQANPDWEILNAYVIPSEFLGWDPIQTSGVWTGKTAPISVTKTITKQTTIDTYVPVNNKVLCYPYNYLLETNNNGSSNIFKYELFTSTPSFSISGVSTIGGSIVSIPTNYSAGNDINALVAGKFPTTAWATDSYTNWLTQQSINIGGVSMNQLEAGKLKGALSVAGGLLGAGLGLATGVAPLATSGVALAGAGVNNILDIMKTDIEYSKIPISYNGNTNAGDYVTASGKNGFYFYKMSIKKEVAKSIDGFFTKYGYKVNTLKVPNFTGRTYFNFVQISNDDIIGASTGNISIPKASMDIINSVFRKGTTIWHNHDNIGNYALSNTIVTP